MKIRTVIAASLALIGLAAVQLGAQVTDSSSPNHVFAQFADGRFSDGTFYRSTMMVSSDSLSAITCTATLFGLSVDGFGNGFSRTFTVASSGWNIYRSPGSQSYDGGYVTLNCSGSVTAQVLYALHSSSGFVLSEATVFSSPAATYAQLLVDQRNGAQLGIAVANNSSSTKEFVIVAIDASDSEVGRVSTNVASGGQIVTFLNELINVPANYVGQVLIYTNSSDTLNVYAIGLRFTGVAFTTIPVTVRSAR